MCHLEHLPLQASAIWSMCHLEHLEHVTENLEHLVDEKEGSK